MLPSRHPRALCFTLARAQAGRTADGILRLEYVAGENALKLLNENDNMLYSLTSGALQKHTAMPSQFGSLTASGVLFCGAVCCLLLLHSLGLPAVAWSLSTAARVQVLTQCCCCMWFPADWGVDVSQVMATASKFKDGFKKYEKLKSEQGEAARLPVL